MGGKKVIAAVLSFLISIDFLFIPSYSNVALAINIEESETIRHELQAEGEKLKKVLKETKDQINKKTEYVKTLKTQIANVNRQINITSDRINYLNRETEKKQAAIINTEREINNNLNVLAKRIKAVYVSGDVNTLDVVFSAKNFDDLVDKMEIVYRMGACDQKLVNLLNEQISVLKKDKETIEKNEKKVLAERSTLSVKQQELKSLQDENEAILVELNVEKEKAQSCIDENDAEYRRIQSQIDEYYESQSKSGKLSKYNVTPSGKRYIWPVPGFSRLSSLFNEKRGSRYHKGIDIAGLGIHGKPILTADSGVVIMTFNGCVHDYGKHGSCGCGGGYGNYVCIDHGGGRCTMYGHLISATVHKGQAVKQGQVIGRVGSTGHSTGPHLHFECRLYNKQYDPMSEYHK